MSISITCCIEDHYSQAQNASQSIEKAKVASASGVSEDQLHVAQA